MTRAETQARLDELNSDPKNTCGSTFKVFCNIHEAALYEAALKYGVDPDSVWFAYEIEEGKGTKWTDS